MFCFLFWWGQGDEVLGKDTFVCSQSFHLTKYMFSSQLHLVVINVSSALSIFFKEFCCDISLKYNFAQCIIWIHIFKHL